MPLDEVAKIVWRWRALPRQVVADIRCHKQFGHLPVPFARRFAEQARLLWSNRITATDYYSLGLFDPSITAAAKRAYIGGFQTRRLFFSINPEEFHHLTDRKLKFNGMAGGANLPVPEILALVSKDRSVSVLPTVTSEDELRSWMVQNEISDIVFKPVDGLKGWGVLSLGARRGDRACWRKLPGEEFVDVAAMWAHCARYLYRGGMIIERRLEPHRVLAEVMPDVLHTVRAVSYLNPEPVIVGAVLRVGSGKGPADNLAQGGIMVPIDIATGRCGRGTMLLGGVPSFVDDHPVSGSRMTGIFVPHWDKVCDVVRAAAAHFRMQRSIGWDVGLTTRGPVLLEGNWCYDLSVNQIANRKGILDTPWAEVFNREGAYRQLGLGFVNRPHKLLSAQ